MLLTISTQHPSATDLGYLLAKHPDRVQTFDLSFGKAHVFYPHAAVIAAPPHCFSMSIPSGWFVARAPTPRSCLTNMSTIGLTPRRRS
jgi:hypothetical protein